MDWYLDELCPFHECALILEEFGKQWFLHADEKYEYVFYGTKIESFPFSSIQGK